MGIDMITGGLKSISIFGCYLRGFEGLPRCKKECNSCYSTEYTSSLHSLFFLNFLFFDGLRSIETVFYLQNHCGRGLQFDKAGQLGKFECG